MALIRPMKCIAILTTVGGFGCGGTAPPPTQAQPAPSASAASTSSAPDTTADLKAQFERELGALPTPLPLEGAGLRVKVPGQNPRLEQENDRTAVLTFSLGTEQEVQCTVLKVDSDPSALMAIGLQKVSKVGEIVTAETAIVARENDRAIWQMEALYKVVRNDTPLAGHYKMVWIDDVDRPMFCEHDEPGYSKTLTKAAQSIASSLEVETPSPRDTTELWARRMMMRRGDGDGLEALPVGFERVLTHRDKGFTKQMRRSSSLVLLAAGGWQAIEVISMTKTRDDGALHAGRFVYYRDNQPLRVVEVQPAVAGAHPVIWREKGGPPQKTSVKAPAGGLRVAPPSDTSLLDGLDASLEREVYAPGVAPDRLTKMKAQRRPDGSGLSVDVGTWHGDYLWDAAGVVQRREWVHSEGLALPLLTTGYDLRLVEP